MKQQALKASGETFLRICASGRRGTTSEFGSRLEGDGRQASFKLKAASQKQEGEKGNGPDPGGSSPEIFRLLPRRFDLGSAELAFRGRQEAAVPGSHLIGCA